MSQSKYRGRFAPSPTGPLHFGSLVAAVGSFVDARAHQGTWLLRIEDVDPPREMPGAADHIRRVLEACGLHWDEEVLYQSRRLDAYESTLQKLMDGKQVFACGCTRKEIADSDTGSEGVYPGTCRDGLAPGKSPRSFRLRVGAQRVCFHDRVQGRQCQYLEQEVGDFVLKRADGCFAYQLAVVVDDAFQRVTDVVRGADLLGSTPRQIHLQHALGVEVPRYMHLPVAVDDTGQKLSKQALAPAVPVSDTSASVYQALAFLNHPPPAELCNAPPAALLDWAAAHWEVDRIPPKQNASTVLHRTKTA